MWAPLELIAGRLKAPPLGWGNFVNSMSEVLERPSRGTDEGIVDLLQEHLDLQDGATKAAWTMRCKKIAYLQGELGSNPAEGEMTP